MKKINVIDLNTKDECESVFLVKFINLVESRDGKSYLNIILGDGTGDIEGRMWHTAQMVAESIKKSDFVWVNGKVNFYQGKKQFIISDIKKIDQSEINMDDFIIKAKSKPDEMIHDLLNIIHELDDVYIKDLLLLILNEAEILRRLKLWQAGKSIHHAYQSGLLEHILSCANLANHLSSHYQVNKNYVVAGCILHDLCKIYELNSGLNVDYTEEGKLVGHLSKGLELLDRYAYKIKNFPYDVKMHLKHILISHHGEYEFGSPKLPQTSEAYLVHLIDLMDSKMNSLEMIKRTDSTPGHWSGFVKHLDRVIYKVPLPYYPELMDAPEIQHKIEEQKPVKKHQDAPIKQSLGKMLEGYKIKE